MNRNQFLIVISLSSLVTFLLIFQIVLGKITNADQVRVAQAQQAINQGQVCLNSLKQLALRIGQVSQQSQDQGLKDLLTRQQIQIGNPQSQPASTDTSSAPAPSTVPAPLTH